MSIGKEHTRMLALLLQENVYKRRFLARFPVLLLIFFFFAYHTRTVAAVSQGYVAAEALANGTVVSLSQDDPTKVEPANSANSDRMLGVVADIGQNLLDIRSSASTVQVTTSGKAYVVVSDGNGAVQAGDLLSPSHVSGVAQKADLSVPARIVGVALEGFTGDEAAAEVRQTSSGPARLGLLAVELTMSEIAGVQSSEKSVFLRVGEAIAGRSVSFGQAFASGLIFIVSMMVSGFIMVGSVRGSFISLGRNPLSANPIFTSLLQVTFAGTTVAVVGLIASYLVLLL